MPYARLLRRCGLRHGGTTRACGGTCLRNAVGMLGDLSVRAHVRMLGRTAATGSCSETGGGGVTGRHGAAGAPGGGTRTRAAMLRPPRQRAYLSPPAGDIHRYLCGRIRARSAGGGGGRAGRGYLIYLICRLVPRAHQPAHARKKSTHKERKEKNRKEQKRKENKRKQKRKLKTCTHQKPDRKSVV